MSLVLAFIDLYKKSLKRNQDLLMKMVIRPTHTDVILLQIQMEKFMRRRRKRRRKCEEIKFLLLS